eukprot:GHVQ01042154.1.p1 GENE.GHVQ01042154.1~~GHVQ01042154.1.p1  ORF type:complete len:145 (+),score=13.74 GHVQ01042154.1:312-746(+)
MGELSLSSVMWEGFGIVLGITCLTGILSVSSTGILYWYPLCHYTLYLRASPYSSIFLHFPFLSSSPFLHFPLVFSSPFLHFPLLFSSPFLHFPLLLSSPFLHVPCLLLSFPSYLLFAFFSTLQFFFILPTCITMKQDNCTQSRK